MQLSELILNALSMDLSYQNALYIDAEDPKNDQKTRENVDSSGDVSLKEMQAIYYTTPLDHLIVVVGYSLRRANTTLISQSGIQCSAMAIPNMHCVCTIYNS